MSKRAKRNPSPGPLHPAERRRLREDIQHARRQLDPDRALTLGQLIDQTRAKDYQARTMLERELVGLAAHRDWDRESRSIPVGA